MQNGRMVVRDGRHLLAPSPCPGFGDQGKPFAPAGRLSEVFRVKAPLDRSRKIPVAVIQNKTITRRQDLHLPVIDGHLEADPAGDLFKVAVILRDGSLHNCGFVKGLGIDADAVSSTVCHEIQEILVIGRDDLAMHMALERLLELKGGVVIVRDGAILHEWRLPVGGTMSGGSLEETAMDLIGTNRVFEHLGCTLEEPLWTLAFLTFTPLIELRMTVSGMYDVKQGKVVFDARNPLF
jgi:adenine deaminase